MTKLSTYEREILDQLNEVAGFTTGRIAKGVKMFGTNMHQHSGAVRSWLVDLKKRGLVDFLDDQKPVCWKRTPAGTAAIQEVQQ